MNVKRIGDFSPEQLRQAARIVAGELHLLDKPRPLLEDEEILAEVERIGKIGALYYVTLLHIAKQP